MAISYKNLWPTTVETFCRNVVSWLYDPSLPKLQIDMNPASATASIQAKLTQAQGEFPAGSLEGWHEIGATGGTPYSSANYSAFTATQALGYTKSLGLWCMIGGVFKSSAVIPDDSTIFTLPVGYRPITEQRAACHFYNGTYNVKYMVHVKLTGAVTVSGLATYALTSDIGMNVVFLIGS